MENPLPKRTPDPFRPLAGVSWRYRGAMPTVNSGKRCWGALEGWQIGRRFTSGWGTWRKAAKRRLLCNGAWFTAAARRKSDHGWCSLAREMQKVTTVETGLGLHALISAPRPRAGSERFDLGSKAKGRITTMFVFPFNHVLRGVAMQMLRRLWKDQDGFVVSTELVLVATILVIGMVVGLATVRNAVVQELGDVAMAIGNINQSYSYDGVTGRNAAQLFTAGSMFEDLTTGVTSPRR
jgi:Flp pilus assembly pilin Flp